MSNSMLLSESLLKCRGMQQRTRLYRIAVSNSLLLSDCNPRSLRWWVDYPQQPNQECYLSQGPDRWRRRPGILLALEINKVQQEITHHVPPNNAYFGSRVWE